MALPPRSLERIARVGLVARALVYVAIGLFATAAALRLGGAITDTSGVFHFLLHQPLGRVLLAALSLGLGAYTVWLLVQVFLDPYGNGTSFIGLVNRFGQLVTALAQLALSIEGARLALGLPSVLSGPVAVDDANERLVAEGLRVPFGVQLVGLVGLILLIVAVIQMYRSLLGDVRRDWRLDSLDENGHWAVRIGRFGLAARAVVLGVSGALVVQAAGAYRPLTCGRDQRGSADAGPAVRLGLAARTCGAGPGGVRCVRAGRGTTPHDPDRLSRSEPLVASSCR